MYKIYADIALIYDSTVEDLKIGKGSISLEVNKSGSFTFSVYPDHFYYDKFVKLKTIITVYKSERIIFRGRILNDTTDYWNVKTLTCEGELGFLRDSIVRPYTVSTTPENVFKKFMSEHNYQVDALKRFKVGKITVTDPNDYIVRENSAYASTFDNLKDRLVGSSLGGYIHITHGDDGTDVMPTINYISDFENVARQTIEFGSNLKDYTKTVKADDIATAIIPIGAEINDGDDSTTDKKLTITGVNDGKDYIYDEAGVAMYGWIFKVVEWQDVTEASNLKRKAEEYLKTVLEQYTSIELTAIDLHLLDKSIESINVGNYVKVVSPFHNLDTVLLCQKQTIDLLKPDNDSIVLGHTFTSFTESNANMSSTVSSLTSIKNNVNKIATQLTVVSDSMGVKVVETEDTLLIPDEYRVFGIKDSLNIVLVEVNDGNLHEYIFEFIPTEDFSGLTIKPEISWAVVPQFPPGKVCQVSIMRGVGVMICA